MQPRPKQILALLLMWFAIELVVCSPVTVLTWRDLRQCEFSPCATSDKATLWDRRRGFAAVIALQISQPMISVVWLAALRRIKSRNAHIGKAILIGFGSAILASLFGWLIYQTYPRPGYWSLGYLLVEIFLSVPILQGVSAFFGGWACGMMDFKFRAEAPTA